MDPTPPAPTMAQACAAGPLFIVFNPRSGRHGPGDDLAAAVRDCGRPAQLITLRRGRPVVPAIRAAAAAAQRAQGVLVAAGGDGTINAVAQAALEHGVPLGVLPRGTFNYFARRHALPLNDDAAALRVVCGARLVSAQVGLVNGRVFLVNASLGLYPTLLDDREHFKQEFGRSRWVALWAGLRTLLRERRDMTLAVELDGRPARLAASTLFLGNNTLQLERVGVPEAQAPEHGRLAALSIAPIGRWRMLGLALRGALGQLAASDAVTSFACRRLEVSPIGRFGLRRAKVAFDGETAWLPWPLVFEVSPRPLALLVPR